MSNERFTEDDRQLLVDYFFNQPGTYKVMPRDLNASGLVVQAGVYYPVGGMHNLICEVYRLEMAQHICNVLNAQLGEPPMNVLSARQLVDMLRAPVVTL